MMSLQIRPNKFSVKTVPLVNIPQREVLHVKYAMLEMRDCLVLLAIQDTTVVTPIHPLLVLHVT